MERELLVMNLLNLNNMEVRITYRSEIYIQGDTLEDIKKTWENINLDDVKHEENVSDYGFVELMSVEDADSYEDLTSKFN